MVSSSAWAPVVAVPSSAPAAPRVVIAWQSEPGPDGRRQPPVSAQSYRQGFNRTRRVLTAREFSEVFSARQALRGSLFVLHYRRNDGANSRLGLVIPKKQAKTAVLRNAIKRQAREVFRRRTGLPMLDLVLRLAQPVRLEHGPGNADKSAWRSEIAGLFDRVERKMPA